MIKAYIISDRKKGKVTKHWFCGRPLRIQRIPPTEVKTTELQDPRRVVLLWECPKHPTAKEMEIMEMASGRGIKMAVLYSGEEPDIPSHLAKGMAFFPLVKDECSLVMVVRGLVAEALEDSSTVSSLFDEKNRSHRLEALGFFATGIAHDFNNILGVIYGFSELALDGIDRESPESTYIKKIIKAADQAGELVRQLVTFGRHREGRPSILKAIPLLKEILKRLSSMDIFQFTVETRVSRLSSDQVVAEPVGFQQIVMTACRLLVRGLGSSGGRMVVSVKDEKISATGPPDLCINMNVEGDRDEITELDDSDRGLSVCHEIIERYGGTIEESTTDGMLTGIAIRLKRPERTTGQVRGGDRDVALPKRMCHILFVDDEPNLVEIGEKRIQKMGHRVTALDNSMEAYRKFSESPGSYDVVITDMTMPGWNGLQLSRRILNLRPDIPVIICTGYYSPVNRDNYRKLGIRDLLIKPVEYKKLAEAVHHVLADVKKEKRKK